MGIQGLARVPAPDAPFKKHFIDPSPAMGSGSCQRDFSAYCPSGFVEVGQAIAGEMNACAPKITYAGPCTRITGFSRSSDKAKARFPDECHAYWPCVTCRHDYGACPIGWEHLQSGACAPTEAYSGPCSDQDFTGYTQSMLEEWASECTAFWPCLQTSVFDNLEAKALSAMYPLSRDAVQSRIDHGFQ